MSPCLKSAPQGKFRGDAEGMVDALIQACQSGPVAPTSCPEWVGRELVRWTDDDGAYGGLDQPLEGGSGRRGQRSPAKHARPAHAPDSPEHRRGFPQASAAHSKRTKVAGTSTPPRSASPRSSNGHAAIFSAAVPAPAPRGYACPALAASPKPENLPMPTTGLMSRALVQRGRSPSPPKDAYGAYGAVPFFGFAPQAHLVRPVAA